MAGAATEISIRSSSGNADAASQKLETPVAPRSPRVGRHGPKVRRQSSTIGEVPGALPAATEDREGVSGALALAQAFAGNPQAPASARGPPRRRATIGEAVSELASIGEIVVNSSPSSRTPKGNTVAPIGGFRSVLRRGRKEAAADAERQASSWQSANVADPGPSGSSTPRAPLTERLSQQVRRPLQDVQRRARAATVGEPGDATTFTPRMPAIPPESSQRLPFRRRLTVGDASSAKEAKAASAADAFTIREMPTPRGRRRPSVPPSSLSTVSGASSSSQCQTADSDAEFEVEDEYLAANTAAVEAATSPKANGRFAASQVDVRAAELATKHHLQLAEVKKILVAFDKIGPRMRGRQQELVSCADRFPEVGDTVQHRLGPSVAYTTCLGDWELPKGDTALVVEVDQNGDFKLRNSQGLVSGRQYRKNFCFVRQATGLYSEFRIAMKAIFEVEEVDATVLYSAFRATSTKGCVDMDSFIQWYVQNMFTRWLPDSGGDSIADMLAKKHNCNLSIIEKIKKQFDRFDLNKNGYIEYAEFRGVIATLFGAGGSSDISEERLRKFWHEVNPKGSSTIDFEEFIGWYLKWFGVEGSDESPVSHAEALYANLRRSSIRRSSV